LLLAYVVWLQHQGQLSHWFNSGFSAGAVATIFVLAVVLIVYTAAVGGGELVRVHQEGLLDLRAGPRAVRWDEMESLTAIADAGRGNVMRHLLRTSDGATLSFGRSIGGIDQLVDEIRVRLIEQRGPDMKTRIADGEVLRFGAIAANEHGMTIGSHVIGWDEVEDIDAEDGEIHVLGVGGTRIGAARLDEVPNAFLLAEIAQGRRAGRRG
jgi:hypothetical protein